MRYWWSWVGLLALGVCVVVLLGLVQPDREPQSRQPDERLFAPIPSERLVDDGVADLLDPLPLSFGLSRVGWEPGILSVDLTARAGSERPEELLGDAYELCRASFERVSNVRQLLLRFYKRQGGRQVMLASADIRAVDWKAQDEGRAEPADGGAEASWLKERLNWTASGREWIANFAF